MHDQFDFGKFPSDEDDRVLFIDWNGGDTPRARLRWPDTFADKYHRDPSIGKEVLTSWKPLWSTFEAVVVQRADSPVGAGAGVV